LDTKKDNEYLPTEGDHEFLKHSLILAYGKDIYEKNVKNIAAM
jgi:aspartate/tyrosine/aromatic aminotransferase